MKTKEELLAMSKEELVAYTEKTQSELDISRLTAKYSSESLDKAKEYLSAIGIIMESYKK